jgi:peptide/nickel transport system ATP-binding protein
MMTDPFLLSVAHLSVSFPEAGGFLAVDDVSFNIARGQTLAIVGESGSGKSLTALALMGLLPKQAHLKGSLRLSDGDRVTEMDALNSNEQWRRLRGQALGMVFQEPMSSLNPVMKVGIQLSEAISTHQRVPAAAAKKLSLEWLDKVKLPIPEKTFDKYPHQLSGGQKQRVMIAMAMCNHPLLLIADEPTTALDVTVQKDIMMLIRELQQAHNTAMIFITHDLALAAETADDILVMYKGRAVENGAIHNVLKNPVHPYTQALLACRPSPAHKGERLPTVSDFLAADTVGAHQDISHKPQSATAVSDKPLLSVRGLKVWFPESTSWLGTPSAYFKAVEDVSFDLFKGEVLGLVGESGCGKSTLGNSLMGLLPVHEGQIIYKEKDLAKLQAKGWKQVRREMQMVFQDPFASLNPRMTIGDMLTEPLIVHDIVPPGEAKKEALRLLDLVHLPSGSIKRYPHQFSGGQRQRLGIARGLALRPEILICDEMVSALDVSVQAQILNLLKELQAEMGLSYLFISHDLSVVHYISDRVMVMKAGSIVESGEASQLLKRPTHEYTKKLVAAMPEITA